MTRDSTVTGVAMILLGRNANPGTFAEGVHTVPSPAHALPEATAPLDGMERMMAIPWQGWNVKGGPFAQVR